MDAHITRPVPVPSGLMPARSSRATAEIPYEEILQRLELGRLQILRSEDGSSLALTSADSPDVDRRQHASSNFPTEKDRRRTKPLEIPTLFPEKGPILNLLVGGFARRITSRSVCATPKATKSDQQVCHAPSVRPKARPTLCGSRV